MNRAYLTRTELASAIARGVRQLVFIGNQRNANFDVPDSADGSVQLFTVDEKHAVGSATTFVSTQFESEELACALSRSDFDRLKTSLFIWLGDASYRTMDAALSTLSFIASLPKGTGVIFDYAERSSMALFAGTALDAFASRVSCAGAVKHLIQPQAVAAMLRGLGFGQMTDHLDDELSSSTGHIVSACV